MLCPGHLHTPHFFGADDRGAFVVVDDDDDDDGDDDGDDDDDGDNDGDDDRYRKTSQLEDQN